MEESEVENEPLHGKGDVGESEVQQEMEESESKDITPSPVACFGGTPKWHVPGTVRIMVASGASA